MNVNQNLLRDYVGNLKNKHSDLLNVIHINAQSLNNSVHFSEFSHIFSDSGIDVITVSETFYNDSSLIDVPNYKVFNANRQGRVGGGVAIYVANHLPAKILFSTSNDGHEPEYLFIEITCQASKILCVCIYRPPDIGHMDLFVTDLYNYLPNYKYVILCGDMNAGFGSGSEETVMIEESLQMCNLTPIAFNNTYRTHYCETNLDVIASNIDDFIVEYGQTPAPGFSYHDLIYAVFDVKIPHRTKSAVYYRNFKGINKDHLCSDFDNAPWHQVFQTNNIDDKVDNFNAIVYDISWINMPP